MSQGLNRVILIGNLGADPELKYTQGNQAVMRLRLATTESFAGRDGQRQQRTEWHSVVIWGKRAEALNKILAKGRTICVEGRIQSSTWDDKDGVRRTRVEIVATDVVLLGGGPRDEAGSSSGRDGGEQRSRSGGYDGGAADDFGGPPDDFVDDDIPF